MITWAQLNAESQTPALTDEQILILTLLVKQYRPYRDNYGRWPSLAVKLATEQTTPTVLTKGLKAVLTQLGVIPPFVVESSGSSESQSFFSTVQNWEALAQDVLDLIFENPVPTSSGRSFAIAQRKTEKIALRDRVILKPGETGRRY
jgi:hypothetical protein